MAQTAPGILLIANKTLEERAVDRDVEQERVMDTVVSVFNQLSGRTLTEQEGWLFMICLKLARATNGKFRLDDAVDGASYFALWGECGSKEADRENNERS